MSKAGEIIKRMLERDAIHAKGHRDDKADKAMLVCGEDRRFAIQAESDGQSVSLDGYRVTLERLDTLHAWAHNMLDEEPMGCAHVDRCRTCRYVRAISRARRRLDD